MNFRPDSDRPVCRHLRTKTLYVPAQAAAEPGIDEAATARHCWCNKTMTAVGLDDHRVNLEACANRLRSCYRASS